MRARHRGTDWPRLDEELSNALEDAFLRGVEEGEKKERKRIANLLKLQGHDGTAAPLASVASDPL